MERHIVVPGDKDETSGNQPKPASEGGKELHHLAIWQLMLANERSWSNEEEVRAGLLHIWDAMPPSSSATAIPSPSWPSIAARSSRSARTRAASPTTLRLTTYATRRAC
jgi:hypothetical protein